MKNENSNAAEGLQKISGTISNFTCTRGVASFVFSETEHTAIGVVAIAASLVGASGQAASTAMTDGLEEADFLEFTLDGQPVKGWVWRSPFNDGDDVEVVAAWQDDHFELYAVARPADRMVALYPHCSRGRTSHWLNAMKWWLIGSTFTVSLLSIMFLVHGLFFSPSWANTVKNMANLVPFSAVSLTLLALLATISLARRWMSFVRLSERVFRRFGWPGAGMIDLRKISKEKRTNADGPEYGVFFFRY